MVIGDLLTTLTVLRLPKSTSLKKYSTNYCDNGGLLTKLISLSLPLCRSLKTNRSTADYCDQWRPFVLVIFSPFSIAITSLGEERANFGAFRAFVRFVLVWICRFPLPLGVWEGLRFVIVALPGLFSYLFLLTNLTALSPPKC